MVSRNQIMVRVFTTTQELIEIRSSQNEKIGLVPTMGNLHDGHISLLQEALKDFNIVYFSIFVNPTQFGPNEDFKRYPRTLQDDLKLIHECLEKYPGKEVYVYAPKDPTEVYPPGKNQVISVQGLNNIIEGQIRPGHFDGVATVVYRLFELTRPKKAYFGLKDYQQWLVIKQMTIDLQLPIEIIGMPIIRDRSGLALSSRNQYLTQEQKLTALTLFKSLNEIVKIISGQRVKLGAAQDKINELKSDPNWNYLEIRDADTLSTNVSLSKKITLLGVYQIGSTRLLDNIQVNIT